MPEKQATHILMDDNRVRRTLRRIAFQVAESLPDHKQLVIAGLNRRGFDVAGVLASFLSSKFGFELPVLRLDVDSQESPKFEADITGKYVLLVDDVLFSGRTMMRALDAAGTAGNPEWIKIAVLIDRGHRKFPLYPEYFGMRHPTKFKEHVHVETGEGKEFKVVLLPDAA